MTNTLDDNNLLLGELEALGLTEEEIGAVNEAGVDTRSLMMMGMCLWEAHLDTPSPVLAAIEEEFGAYAARDGVIDIARRAVIGWEVHYARYGNQEPDNRRLYAMDYEFAPWFVANCLKPTGEEERPLDLVENWLDLCRDPGLEVEGTPSPS